MALIGSESESHGAFFGGSKGTKFQATLWMSTEHRNSRLVRRSKAAIARLRKSKRAQAICTV